MILSLQGEIFAQPPDSQSVKNVKETQKNKIPLEQEKIERDKIALLQKKGEIDAALVEQAEADTRTSQLLIENIYSEITELNNTLAENRKIAEKWQYQREQTRKKSLTSSEPQTQEKELARIEQQWTETQEEIARLEQNLSRAKQRWQDAQSKHQSDLQWFEAVQAVYHQWQRQTLEQKTEFHRQQYLQQATEYRKQLAELPPADSLWEEWHQRVLETQVLEAEERAQWITREAKLHRIGQQLRRIDSLLSHPKIEKEPVPLVTL